MRAAASRMTALFSGAAALCMCPQSDARDLIVHAGTLIDGVGAIANAYRPDPGLALSLFF
jgi:hypothetical protein